MSETGGPEHDYEPVPGLPGRLPEGEHILWQGAPSSAQVSRQIMKTRWIAGYFAVLVLWNITAGIYDGRLPSEILFSSGALAILSTIAIALLEAFAWGVQKTTLYTITNKRIVMRIGVALSATFNLPFTRIVSADMREDKNGNGDIALTLKRRRQAVMAGVLAACARLQERRADAADDLPEGRGDRRQCAFVRACGKPQPRIAESWHPPPQKAGQPSRPG
jgi:hypothetical protein